MKDANWRPHLSRRAMGPLVTLSRVLLTADFQLKGNEPPWKEDIGDKLVEH